MHIVHLSSASALARSRAARRRPAAHGGDLAALPPLRRRARPATARTEFKCAPPIRERDNREAALARPGDGPDRAGRQRSLAVHAGAQGEAGRLRERLGRHRLAAARAADRLDRGARRAAHGSTTSPRWMQRGTGAAGGPGRRRARIAAGNDADFIGLRSRRDLHRHTGDCPAPPQGHAVRSARRCAAWCVRRSCAADRCTRTARTLGLPTGVARMSD